MSVVATVEIPASAFTLSDSLHENPGISVRLERVVPVGSTVMPYFWATDHDIEGIIAALEADEDIASFDIVDTIDGEALVRAEWNRDRGGLLSALAETDATIYEALGTGDSWTLSLRFEEEAALSRFYHACLDRDIPVDVQTIHDPGVPEQLGLGIGLTEIQRETLLVALEAGYFDVPRGINLTTLAQRLDISDTAASQRIRRGICAVLTATIADTN